MTKIHRDAMRVLSSLGARDMVLEEGRHYKLRYTYDGRPCTLTIARSPSDHRFLANVRRDFHREARRGEGR